MGNCLCKDSAVDGETYGEHNHVQTENTIVPDFSEDNIGAGDTTNPGFKFPTSANVDKLVLETLGVIGRLVDKYESFELSKVGVDDVE